VDEEHQKAMRLYLDTWVRYRIELILRWSRGEINLNAYQDWGNS